jgi:ParB family chromosome partitioning protein
MREVILINPERCRIWENHGRLAEYITEESCRAEIDSFAAHGQLLPVVARRVTGDLEHDFEVICGARRLFIARHLNVPLQADIRDLTDREAVIALEIENCHRKDISAYERGRSYARWLADGYFSSQGDIAHTLEISPSQVSRLLKIARLPSVIVNAFDKPFDICENWGLHLYEAWEDQNKRPHLAAKARCIAKNEAPPSASAVYEQLISSASPKEVRITRARDEVVRSENGEALFRIQYRQQAIALVISTENIASGSLHEIKEIVSKVLQKDSTRTSSGTVDRKSLGSVIRPVRQMKDNKAADRAFLPSETTAQ